MRKLLCFWGMVLPVLTASSPSAEEIFEAKLMDRIRAIDNSSSGVLGVYIIDLTSGRTLSFRGDTVFAQASSIKIPIMIEAFRQVQEGKMHLTDNVTIQPSQSVAGSGHLRLLLRERALTMSFKDLITAMIETSDNTATNRIIAMLGMENVNSTVEKLGLHQTRLRRIMLDTGAAERNEENVSTPAEMAHLMKLLYEGKAVSTEASRQMIAILQLVSASFRAVIPAEVSVAAKPGELTGVRCETGIVFLKNRPFILSVAGTFLTEPENPIRSVAKAVYDYFAILARSNRFGNGAVR